MTNKNLDGEELLKAWFKCTASGITMKQHAEELGIPYEIYKARIYRAKANRRFEKINRPELFNFALPVEWYFEWEDFIVVGDVHLPTTNYDFATLPAYVAYKNIKPPRRLIIAGDLFNFDAYSKYEDLIQLPSIKDEMDAGRNLLGLWSIMFDEMYFLMGNHDQRIIKRLDAQMSMQDIVSPINEKLPLGKVQASVRDACVVKTSQGSYRVQHGGSYRKKPLSVLDEDAQKYQMHIIGHHQHHAAFGMDIYDRYFIIDNGGLFNYDNLAYVQLTSKASAGMSNAFTVVKGGYPYLLGKWTDWSRWV